MLEPRLFLRLLLVSSSSSKPPCTVLFCGGTDWENLGRRPTEGGDVSCPKVLSFPKRIKYVASGPTAFHSVCIDVHGGVRLCKIYLPPCLFIVLGTIFSTILWYDFHIYYSIQKGKPVPVNVGMEFDFHFEEVRM